MNSTNPEHQIQKDPRTAILLVTPGTTRIEAKPILEKLVDAFKNAYPDTVVRYAIESELVRQIKAKEGIIERSPFGALADLIDEGFSRIIVQPLYITPGDGLHDLYSTVTTLNNFSGKHESFGIDGILIGKPLLTNTSDYKTASEILASYFGVPEADEAIVLLSSVDEKGGDSSLCQLQLIMDRKTKGRIVLGNTSGYPDISWVIERLEHINSKKIKLAPFALIPGNHSVYELGDENEKSWKKIIQAAGYNVSVSDRVLGESDEIIKLFIESAAETGESHSFL